MCRLHPCGLNEVRDRVGDPHGAVEGADGEHRRQLGKRGSPNPGSVRSPNPDFLGNSPASSRLIRPPSEMGERAATPRRPWSYRSWIFPRDPVFEPDRLHPTTSNPSKRSSSDCSPSRDPTRRRPKPWAENSHATTWPNSSPESITNANHELPRPESAKNTSPSL
jgi:hypothetical protein